MPLSEYGIKPKKGILKTLETPQRNGPIRSGHVWFLDNQSANQRSVCSAWSGVPLFRCGVRTEERLNCSVKGNLVFIPALV